MRTLHFFSIAIFYEQISAEGAGQSQCRIREKLRSVGPITMYTFNRRMDKEIFRDKGEQ